MNPCPRVSIVYPHLPQYRLDFFSGLRDALAGDGVQLDLYYGKNPQDLKGDERDLEWATPLRNRVYRLGKQEFAWQSVSGSAFSADMVVLLQNTRVVSNLATAVRFWLNRRKVAFWGHGINYQAAPNSFGNKVKSLYSRRADWFFAYTQTVADHVAAMGYPVERITVVENAIDTRSLLRGLAALTEQDVIDIRRQLRLGPGPVGLYCGGMYDLKRLPFLIDACRRIRSRVPQFQMIFLGSGTDADAVRKFAAEAEWVRYIGPRFGADRIPYFKMSSVFLMPGLVGLAVLDSFALETPMITTAFPYHSPEIDYLQNGINGLITDDSADAFVDTTVHLLENTELLKRLRRGCRVSALHYTNENMVANFRRGILGALAD